MSAPTKPARMPPLLLPNAPSALAGMLAALLGSVLRVAVVPVFVTPVFDQVVGAHDLSRLPRILVLAGAVALGGALALWAQDALLGRAAAQVTAAWRSSIYRRLLRRPPGQLPGSSGGLASRILTDLREIETYYHFGIGTLVAESGTTLAIFAYLLHTDPGAAILLVLFGLPLLLALRWAGAALERVAERSQIGTEALGRHLQEGLRHHETVRAFDADDLMVGRFEPANRRTARAMTLRSVISGAQVPITQVLLFAALALLVVLLAGRVQRGALSAGQLVSFVTLVALLSTPAQLLPKGHALWREARSAARRLRELARQPASGERARAAAPQPSQRGKGLTLSGVRFRFPDGPLLLDGIDLALPETGLVALTGESGSGKTTLLRLMLGFLQPQEGAIWLDGEALAGLPEASLRARVSYVPQTHEVLSGPLRQSLLMGRNLPEARLWQALAEVGLADFVHGLPGGLDHRLAEDGAGFSGGQRQRLALARATLSEPGTLLLDEPTSNLDADAEAALVTTLRDQAARRLVLAVSHRPALVEAAQQVWRLAAGRLERVEATGLPSSASDRRA